MKKITVICLLLSFLLTIVSVDARIVRVARVDNSYCSPYQQDLEQMEDYLFGKVYSKEAPGLRLNRIENSLFNTTYPTMNIAQRMNRALENYRDDYYNRNYLTQYSGNSGVGRRFRNRFFGQPTGFTPPIMNMPFASGGFMPGMSYGNIHNRSYRYNNVVPANMGAGITILD
ncbi:MAG: hypothetical protein E7Z87_02085 [Cyanobacteria bacterium SIG26]|nr:hypothetical protein [Cyanobacteria bacterium SIG26]